MHGLIHGPPAPGPNANCFLWEDDQSILIPACFFPPYVPHADFHFVACGRRVPRWETGGDAVKGSDGKTKRCG